MAPQKHDPLSFLAPIPISFARRLVALAIDGSLPTSAKRLGRKPAGGERPA
jgi:hypothetical protein